MLTPSCGGKETIRLSDELEEMHFSMFLTAAKLSLILLDYCNTSFKKQYALTPKEYRSRYKQNS